MFENNNAKAPRSENEVLVANDLRKFYGPREALRGLSFSLQAGRILGFLGPNGAGKTTSIRILTTILEPDAGHFVVDGISSKYPNEIRRRIGVLPESFGLPKQMTGIEYLTFFGQLYGRSAADARKHGMALLEEVGLKQRAKSLTSTYSHGMRQRLGVARALVNDPAVLFLDEPTLGLDPRGQQELLGLIRQITQERKAGVILCSHLLSEVESVCDDVIILSSGQIIASGTVSGVIGQTQSRRSGSIRIQIPPSSVAEARRILAAVPNVMKVVPTSDDAGWLRVELADPDHALAAEAPYLNNRMLEALIRAEIPILSFQPEGGRLQDVFLHLTAEAMK
ncbi:MAG: ABC transporter ATP-binding protein [candidate division KSB1 bacterium]|nr:ABC transporter ATP-binding protein [candidate division KSB1 bacterium]MDZ7300678.1 ABC transporter ATP-binding protein [candidate division KSB1 bacterium]MDZ7309814.1 ABC transporter ATP-binding protein [candidate division KSB1 bacterium]